MDRFSLVKYAATFMAGGVFAVSVIVWYVVRAVNKTVDRWNSSDTRPRITITPLPQRRNDEKDWRA